MYQRGKRFYADWRDSENVRHRKSFSSAPLAQEFERAQAITRKHAELRQLKNGQAVTALRTVSVRSKRAISSIAPKPRNCSSKAVASSTRAKSTRATSMRRSSK